MGKGRAGVFLAAMALVAGAPPVLAATDLASLLAPAPALTWIEATPSNPQVLEGPFTATSYGAFVDKTNGTPSTTTSTLTSLGLTGGYGKEWLQLGSSDLLVERVFQFDAESGATTWYEDIKAGSQRLSSYQESFVTDSIPDSFGAILKDTSPGKQWRTYFHKANFVFVVHVDSRKDSEDLQGLAISQTQTEYRGAPSSNVQLSSNAPSRSWAMPVAIGGVLFFVLLAVAVFAIVAIASRRRHGQMAIASPLHLSPDGAYWWDGVRWHDAHIEIPPTAQRSPDGAYWWDGRGWRLVGS